MSTEYLKQEISGMTRDEMKEYIFNLLDRMHDLTSKIDADNFYNAYGTLYKCWEWNELKELATDFS